MVEKCDINVEKHLEKCDIIPIFALEKCDKAYETP
jgi:hypothetical protein